MSDNGLQDAAFIAAVEKQGRVPAQEQLRGNHLMGSSGRGDQTGSRDKTGPVKPTLRSAWGRAGGSVAAAVAIALCSMLVAPPLSAEPSARERARAKLVEGAKLFADGEFEAALRLFRSAQTIYPSGKINYNIGLAYRGLGKPAQALIALQGFLRDPGDATSELMAEAREAVEELSKKVAFLSISSDTPSAETLLDGVAVGGSRPVRRLPIEVGQHELTMTGPKVGERSRRFTAQAGQDVELKVDFAPSALNQPAPTATPPRVAGARPSGAVQAEALISEATALRRAGKDARAYPLLQRAFEAEPTPRTEAQLGLVEIMLGYSLLAEKHLAESLAATRDAWIASNRAELEESLARVRASIGEVLVTGSPAGASVLVNGWEAGNLPLSAPIRAGEGPLNLEVRAPGYVSFHRSLTVAGGKSEKVAVALGKLQEPAPPPAGTEKGQSVGPTDDDRAWQSRSRSPVLRPLAWTASAAAILTLGLGAYETLAWREKLQQFESHVGPRISVAQGGVHPDDIRLRSQRPQPGRPRL